MPIYEMTLRYESPDDHAAMSVGIRMEDELKAIAKQARLLILSDTPVIAVQKVAKIVVSRET